MVSLRTPIVISFCLFLLFLFPGCHKKINQNKNKVAHGLWIIYTDSTKTKLLTKGRYKNGTPVGKWVYNLPDGSKERVEKYRGMKMRIKHFHPNGTTALKGKARIVVEEKKIHFYYYGPWKFYSENGKLEKIAYYKEGQKIKEDIKAKGHSAAYDSLNLELVQLDKDFIKYRDTLNITLRTLGKNSPGYISLKQLAKENDSLIYVRIEKIVKRFGYPQKYYTGEKNSIIFFIIGFAPLNVRGNYIELFRKAAEHGEIALRDFAYFEDKFWVAKTGYQVYGTQSKYDKDHKEIFYPVKDLSGMNDRRKAMGFEGVNLLEYKEYK